MKEGGLSWLYGWWTSYGTWRFWGEVGLLPLWPPDLPWVHFPLLTLTSLLSPLHQPHLYHSSFGRRVYFIPCSDSFDQDERLNLKMIWKTKFIKMIKYYISTLEILIFSSFMFDETLFFPLSKHTQLLFSFLSHTNDIFLYLTTHIFFYFTFLL